MQTDRSDKILHAQDYKHVQEKILLILSHSFRTCLRMKHNLLFTYNPIYARLLKNFGTCNHPSNVDSVQLYAFTPTTTPNTVKCQRISHQKNYSLNYGSNYCSSVPSRKVRKKRNPLSPNERL